MSGDREYDFGLAPGERYEPEDNGEETSFDLALPHVMTVLGPIRPDELGVTLTHEHLIAKPPRSVDAAPDLDLILDDPLAALAELEDLYAAGGRTVLDATTADYGRDAETLSWVAARAPVHVIAVTGYHKELHSGGSLAGKSADDIAAVCIAELIDGIANTDVRPGAIKAGTSLNQITPCEEVALRGAAMAHLATHAPILTHCDRGTMALEQFAILTSEGVDPARVALCNQDHRLDETYLQSVLATGAWISFDQISKSKYAPDTERASMVARLVGAGFGGRILLSGDLARRSYLRAYGGTPGLIHLVESFPLLLMEAGLDAAAVRQLLIDNPASFLTIA